jgi:hypothetical protein
VRKPAAWDAAGTEPRAIGRNRSLTDMGMSIETLAKFCAGENDWRGGRRPVLFEGMIYATDQRIAVRIPQPAGMDFGAAMAVSDMDGLAASIAKLFASRAGQGLTVSAVEALAAGAERLGVSAEAMGAPKVCSRCGGKPRVACECCNSTGLVDFSLEWKGRIYEHEEECPVCNGAITPCCRCGGTGQEEDRQAVPVGDALYGALYLRLIAECLPGARLPVSALAAGVPAFFEFEGGEGMVMQMRR